jgi:DHA3 family tetracycline resistance protein-like MFS transporter
LDGAQDGQNPDLAGPKVRPFTVYLILEASSSLLFSLIFTVNMLYQVMVVGLNPLQLVLVGTILEATVFLFEIPTGVLADVKSRRLSVIVGYVLMGVGFLLEGLLPFFASVAVAQVVWGFGYTFTSGAQQAWIADEVGEQQAGQTFLRGAQAARVGALIAIPISVALGRVQLQAPIVLAGALMILLAGFLVLSMTERGFSPAPLEERTSWGLMIKTARDARGLLQGRPVLLVLLAIALFYGLYSEGFDRLWTPHLLDNFSTAWMHEVEPVVWFGGIRAVLLVICLGATELVRRRLDLNRALPIARVLMANAGLIVIALAGFGLTRLFWIALALYWLVGVLRSVADPIYTAWFNLQIDDPQVRATMFSVSGQVDAIGQIAGGPAVGAIGNHSIRTALVASALILSPVLPLYSWAIRRSETEAST